MGEPQHRGPDNFLAVAMLERQNQLPTILMIEHGGAARAPWPGDPEAVIAGYRLALILSGKGDAAQVTGQSGDERRITPAGPTKAEFAFHLGPAQDTAGRINQLQRCLKRNQRHLTFCAMTTPLTDRAALIRNRARAAAAPVTFLQEAARDEIEDRLALVKKSFRNPAVIRGFEDVWDDFLPGSQVVEDQETLPLEQNGHDLVVHAMCLHWADDPVGQLIQARRALCPDGLFLGVMLGGETLHELRAALAQAEADLFGGLSPRVAPMAEIRDLGALLQRAGFALPVADSVRLTANYASPLRLMRELRFMGEGNALHSRRRTPTSKALFQRAGEIYVESFGDKEGRVPATFEFIVLTGWAPDPSQPQPLRPGSASKRLADALGAEETRLKD